jgi:GTP-binding protein HflX
LEEVLEADVILHVRDISHPETYAQRDEVDKILHSLEVNPDVPMIEVWNKMDLLEPDQHAALQAEAARRDNVVTLSAVTGEGLDVLLAQIAECLSDPTFAETLSLDWAKGRLLSWLHEQDVITAEREDETGWIIDVRWTKDQARRFNVEQSRG